MKKQLIEGEDFYYNDEGKMVMAAQYHIHRGYCCGNGCKHCPYKAPSNSPDGGGIEKSSQMKMANVNNCTK